MKATKEDILKFDAYLRGEMSEEEILLFESRLSTDAEFKEEFELHELIVEGIAAEKEQRFRAVLAEQRADTFIGNNTWGKKFTLVSAAVVLVGMLVMVYATYLNYNPGASPLAKKNQRDTRATEQKNRQEEEPQTAENVEKPIVKLEEEANSNEPPIQANMQEEVAEDGIANDVKDFDENSKITPKDADLGAIPLDFIPSMENKNFEVNDVVDDEVVQKDKLEGQEVLYAKVVSAEKLNEESITLQEVAASKRSENLVKTTSKKSANKEDKKEKAANEDQKASSPEKFKALSSVDSTQKYTVQYFNSPLNYKGYKYNSKTRTIQVYGMKKNESQLIMRANTLFLKNGEEYFIITPNTEFSPLNKLTNQNLIKQLK